MNIVFFIHVSNYPSNLKSMRLLFLNKRLKDRASLLGLFFYIEFSLITWREGYILKPNYTNEVLEYGREDNSRKITTD